MGMYSSNLDDIPKDAQQNNRGYSQTLHTVQCQFIKNIIYRSCLKRAKNWNLQSEINKTELGHYIIILHGLVSVSWFIFFRLFFGVVFGVLAGFGVVGFSSSFSLFLGVLGAAWPASCSLPDSLSSPLFFFLQLRHWNHPWPLSLGQRLVLQACFSLALISSLLQFLLFSSVLLFLGAFGGLATFVLSSLRILLRKCCIFDVLLYQLWCFVRCFVQITWEGMCWHLNCLLSACFLCW